MSILQSLANLSHSLPQSRNKARLGRVFTKMILHGQMSAVTEIQMRDGSKMLLDARSRTESGAFWNGEYDRDDIDFFKACIAPGDTVFDVGANVGLITIPLAYYLRDSGGTVVAFEPVKTNFDRLVDTIHINQLDAIVKPFNIALGDEEGEIEMALETRNILHKGVTTGNAVIHKGMEDSSRYTLSTARIARLDTFVAENKIKRVDFIKVDIEGAELLFLRGGAKFLQEQRPVIYGEFNFPMMPRLDHTFLDVAKLIQPWGYKIFAFADRLEPVEILEPKVGIGNIFLAPEERTSKLLQQVAAARQKDSIARR